MGNSLLKCLRGDCNDLEPQVTVVQVPVRDGVAVLAQDLFTFEITSQVNPLCGSVVTVLNVPLWFVFSFLFDKRDQLLGHLSWLELCMIWASCIRFPRDWTSMMWLSP